MIANARMYSVSSEVAELWRRLLTAIAQIAELPVMVIEHREPAPLEELWSRADQAAVFMCGLPFSRAERPPLLIAAPVPSPAEYAGKAQYWSELVVRRNSRHAGLADTYGGRIAFTVPGSQSGCVAALSFFKDAAREPPLFRELIAPTITPLGALSAVVRGDADVAPIDSYAFALLQRYRADLASQVRIIGRTSATPIPPLVASAPVGGGLQAAFLQAHRLASIKSLMESLLLQRFVRPDAVSYGLLRDRFLAAASYWAARPFAEITHPAFATPRGMLARIDTWR